MDEIKPIQNSNSQTADKQSEPVVPIKPIAENGQPPMEKTPDQAPIQTPPQQPVTDAKPAVAENPAKPTVVPKEAVISRGKPKRLSRIIGIILGILVVGAAVFFIFFYRVTIDIEIPNKPDSIILDGNTTSSGVHKVMPGNHSLVITKEGYISIRVSQKMAIGEKITLNFPLQAQTEPQLLANGATEVSPNLNGTFINFVTQDNRLSTVPATTDNGKFSVVGLSDAAFGPVKQALFAKDNTFALVFDSSALQLVDFKKTNLTNQVVHKLPPDASKISAITWNNNAGDYTGEANGKIIYDLKTDSTWNLIMANRTHSQSEILMNIDSKTFSGLYFNWGENPQKVLIAGGELGVLDLPSRTYQTIDKTKDIHFAIWGPTGKYALAVGKNGDVFELKDNQLQSLNYKTAPGQVMFISASEAIIVSSGRPVRINFDTGQTINYAEIKGLGQASSVGFSNGSIFFTDQTGLETAPLTENVYSIKEGQVGNSQ
jgi:hypothetical protein